MASSNPQHSKVYSISGGASGLGEALARALLAKGANVLILDRDAKRGEALRTEFPAQVEFQATDVTSHESVTAAFAACHARFGRLDGIINCAGLGPVEMTVSAAATRGSCRCGCGRSCDRHRCRRYDLVPSPLNPPRTLYARR